LRAEDLIEGVMRAIASTLLSVAAGTLVASAPAAAQNYDAAFQVRSGVFAQWGIIGGESAQGPTIEHFSFPTLAVGFTAGFEYVRKETWSYGIEIDGGVHSGETKIPITTTQSGALYGPNYSASLRLRAGRHMRPDLFWYGTLGIGVLGAEIRATTPGPFGETTKLTGTRSGLIIGTGLEMDFGPGLWFAEYLYADYDGLRFADSRVSFDPSSHSLRLGVKFKVGHDHYHDDVLDRIGRRK
jgi:opacity protein-like surface antigen